MDLSEKIVEVARGLVRPVCTIFSLVSCVAIYCQVREVPEWLIGFTATMLIFWFGEKAVKRIKET